jgi:hypothetical protein
LSAANLRLQLRVIEMLIQGRYEGVKAIVAITEMLFDGGSVVTISCAGQVRGKIDATQA